MKVDIQAATRPLRGTLGVPSDKSISHRAVLFAAMAQGTSRITGALDSADVRSTIAAVTALGADVRFADCSEAAPTGGGLDLVITGWGARGPLAPTEPIDCGNSGTTARLLLGVLAGWPGTVTLTGDESLSTRPMRRVTDPLESMGARFETDQGHLPVTVHGGALAGVEYTSPVASAQVKSAVLLAGLRAQGRTVVTEPALSRDHTERMLPAFGVDVGRSPQLLSAWVDGPAGLRAADVAVPSDPSSAAFMAVAAALVPGSEVVLPHVGLNPGRTGFLRVLERMGAAVDIEPDADSIAGEPAGTVTISHAGVLSPVTVTAAEVPSLVDEIPILAVAAAAAQGISRFEGVGELRVKESDRLEAIRAGFSLLGVDVAVEGEVLEISGLGAPTAPAAFTSATLDSLGDHRLAMAWAIAGLAAAGPVSIDRFEAVEVSYPTFLEDLFRLTTVNTAEENSR